MPTAQQLLVVCVVAAVMAVAVVLVLHAVGYGEHAVVGGAVSAAASASVASMQFRRGRRRRAG